MAFTFPTRRAFSPLAFVSKSVSSGGLNPIKHELTGVGQLPRLEHLGYNEANFWADNAIGISRGSPIAKPLDSTSAFVFLAVVAICSTSLSNKSSNKFRQLRLIDL